jgi:hypothetical protein
MRQQDAIRDRLLRQLPQHGWRRVDADPSERAWHLQDLWELESLWSPQGVRVRLYFWGARWTDSVTRIEARDPEREEPEGEEVGVAYNWRDSLPWVFAALSRVRNRRAAAGESDAEPREVLDGSTWATWADPEEMIALVRSRGRAGERTLRLFAAGCCRRMGHLLEDPRNLRWVEAMEAYADGLAGRRETKKARKAARLPWLASLDPALEARQALQHARQVMTRTGYAGLADLVRELFGDPWLSAGVRERFRDVWRRWDGGAVVKMATAIDAERSYADLPILADALADAGCEETVLLDHLRGPSGHAPGCWAVDLVLGRGL